MSVFAGHPEIARTLADVLSPPPSLLPSEWAEQHVVLSRVQSASRPGPYSVGHWPWLRDTHDLMAREPHKRGLIMVKAAQMGITRASLNIGMHFAASVGGNVGMCIKEKDAAADFATDNFDSVVEQSPKLRRIFGKDAPGAKDRREVLLKKPHQTGAFYFFGAGATIASLPFTLIMVDEYDIFMDNYPSSAAGDGWTMVQGRGDANRAIAKQMAFGHPRRKYEGIHGLYMAESDMRSWVWDCPHCGLTIDPLWRLVRCGAYAEVTAGMQADLDPETAWLMCPGCSRGISDSERAATCQTPRDGGSARYETIVPEGYPLTKEQIAQREYIGLRLHRLSDPGVTVREMARRWVVKKTPQERMAWLNMQGEPYEDAGQALSESLVTASIARMPVIELPGDLSRGGVAYLTCGVDVQAPRANPTLVTTVSAWTVRGMQLVVAAQRLSGFASLAEFLRSFRVPVTYDNQPSGELPIRLCAIDCAYETRQVLDFCRQTIVPVAGHRPVLMAALRFAPHVTADAPAVEPREEKRTDPMRPHLGPLQMRELHRHSWVDRAIKRLQAEPARVRVLCDVPPDWAAHHTANVMTPVTTAKTRWEPGHEEWTKIKDRRDDWMMANVYAEAGAALWLQLDRLFELVTAPAPNHGQQPASGPAARNRREGYLGVDRSRGWLSS